MSTHQEISSFIWNVCDDVLRGLFKQHEYGDVILPFVVLRRLDCVIEPKKDKVIELYKELKDEVDPTPIIKKQTGLKFFNHSNFDLQRLKGDPNGLKVNFPNYINGFSQNVFEILENFQLEKPVEKLLKNNKLYLLIDKFTEVDLHPNKVDNHTMGQIFEELLRKFSEMSNETSGEHYTPRDVVKLLVSLVFSGEEDNLSGEGIIRSIFDPCAGTGGMLTIGKEWIEKNVSNKVRVNLYGQELNPQTYSICKSDMLITGEDPDNIKLGSSLSMDQFEGRKFDYMITNPPFGVSWKSEKEFVDEESKNPMGRFSVGTPRSSDGSLLFLQHMISKMKDEGSRIGVVFNGSPLFTGDAGSGESEIRRWIIENDWLECIVSLPDQLFFNTGISTYIWVVTNKKKPHRKGKIQLIDGSSFYSTMKKSLGSKRKYISKPFREELIQLYRDNQESEFSKIFDNEFFGYTKVVIEQSEMENGEVVTKRDGSPKPDTSKRDYERVPLTDDIDDYFNREVKPHLPKSWMERSKDKVGYEINFTKYFYKYKPLRSLEEITSDLLKLEEESEGIFKEIVNE
ncbi:SAM-dependent DNA methyltransferase [Aureitalea sp. L0-47]|uniref:type I restriction-modification system subunit M n=1 Tax=Aureitalea sp. L0-47 TaxID=2816962 RepID=UPI0022390CCB|nr:class I SAM-dependent DNA methyltransferase [Aureitalea sp. L0-47]MCW5520184.1 SAM-dependent DNA methyltransferase [Aureitalea sp. L0-47]